MNLAIRSRSSSKPKLIEGSESAIEGARADESGGRMALVERDGSKAVAMFIIAGEVQSRKCATELKHDVVLIMMTSAEFGKGRTLVCVLHDKCWPSNHHD